MGREFETKTTHQAKGFRRGNHVKLVCAIDPETFEEIRARAVQQQTSVAEQVRILIEFGLEVEAAGF